MSFIDGPHPLLEACSPPYTNATVRRAFIVWMHCGQRNSFKDVCNYFHYLENLEDKLPADRRATSRHHEFNMFSNPPPTSSYLDQIFPKLYSQSNTIQHCIKKVDAIKNDSSVFKLEGFTDIKSKNGATVNEIIDTSHMIKKYCKSRMIPLNKFLIEFKEYARKCELNCTVHNVAFYIKRKMVEEELLMVENYSKTLKHLNLDIVEKIESALTKSSCDKSVPSVYTKNGTKTNENRLNYNSEMNSEKQITILTRDNKKGLTNQLWNDLTFNFAEISLRKRVTTT